MLGKSDFLIGSGAFAGILVASGFTTTPFRSDAAPSLQAANTTHTVPVEQRADACERLTGTKVADGLVEGAERFANGELIAGGATTGAKAAADLCRVRLTLRPVPGSEIKVEVWLPDNWNGKLMGFGGGGFDGSLNKDSGAFLNQAVAQGYASVATDVGHTPAPTPGTWIHKQREKVVDFGHRGTHLAAVVAKQVITARYGTTAKRAYFQGCSNGGRDALMLVTRYPGDYDAVVAGAPAIRYLEVVTQLVTNSQTVATAPRMEAKLGLVHDAILQKCDALDGVKDGILENPLRCNFDPAELQCSGAEGLSCLSASEVGAFRKIYTGPRPRNGQRLTSPPMPGSEGLPGNWSAWVTGPVPRIAGEEFYRWMVYDDPAWSIRNFDFDRDYAAARARIAPVINVENPDIRPFIRRGGKLIIYQGWDDPAITPGMTLGYYSAIRRKIGRKATDRHVRLFMVPGMAHCGGGPGATSFDMQRELEKWDASDAAPTRIPAFKPDIASGEQPFSRPLCAWPSVARYNGSGSIRDAANFSCRPAR